MDTNPTDHPSNVDLRSILSIIADPRRDHCRRHDLSDVLFMATCAVICGADGWVAVEEWAVAKEEWLTSFLDLPHGIPSHDTFGRIFALLEPAEFERSFSAWMRAVSEATDRDIVPIDGKVLRRSFDRAKDKSAIHMVSAWSTTNAVVLGQVSVDQKSNEITAVPRLLKLLHLSGCIVTIDAMGCQKEITAEIVAGGGDYVIAVKDNQPTLHRDVQAAFDEGLEDLEEFEHDYAETENVGHGRHELRMAWTTGDLQRLSTAEDWAGLRSVIWVQAHRTLDGKTSVHDRFFISSLDGTSATDALKAIRRHWAIENELHWTLDVAFREDDSRIRIGHAAENMSRLRHFALSRLKAEKSTKLGIKSKRLKAGWDQSYLLRVLGL